MLRRQREFRKAAELVARAMAELPQVQKVVLFGSVAVPLCKEVPRFREFCRAGVAIWHECKDVDLAVWVTDLENLKSLQRARSRALTALLEEHQIGVAHHQVDVFLIEPGSNRYLGRLCRFGQCPKGKLDCLVPGCGQKRFLRQHQDFVFQPESLEPGKIELLFSRENEA
jgi:predicted nucleotidyltransferase